MTLTTFGSGQGYLKAGFFGFNKSGKTYTAVLLALQLMDQLKLPGAVGFADTEGGGEYIVGLVKKRSKRAVVGIKSRSLKDLISCTRECENGAASVLIVDSVTHYWREVCDAYLDQVNQVRSQQGKPTRTRLEFQDWNIIKSIWNRWTDLYLNAKLHIIICGRAGYDWDFEDHEQTDGSVKKELVKTGTKMKVETEFGFEPSLLVEMERIQEPDANRPGHFRLLHRATVLGDRFGVMDGLSTTNPVGVWFQSHIACLVPGSANIIDTSLKTDAGISEAGDAAFYAERRKKTELLEEIQGELVKAFPGQSAKEKRAKVAAIEAAFSTKSWTAVEGKSIKVLAEGLTAIREWLAQQDVPAEAAKEE